MLKYIVSGENTSPDNSDINDIEKVIKKVKSRKEVTIAYMRQWERELSIKRDERLRDALEVIRFGREDGVPDDKTRVRLRDHFDLNDQAITELFEEADKEAPLIN